MGPDVSGFLEHYLVSLRRNVLHTDKTHELAINIYDTHSEAMDLILKAKAAQLESEESKEQNLVWSIVEQAIHELGTDLQFPGPAKPYRGLSSPSLDEVSTKLGLPQSSPVFFDIMYRSQRVRIRLMVGPGQQELRERLRQLAEQSDHFSVGKNFGEQWGEIYQKVLLDKKDFNPLEGEAARFKVEQATREFRQNDYYPLVNAIRVEFGLPPVSSA